MTFRRVATSMLILISLVCGQARQITAQTAVDGAIGGTVKDTQGAVIPDAIVLVHNDSTNSEQTVKTDAAGYFRVLHLPAGLFTVTVKAQGFGTYQSTKVSVQVGSMTNMEAKMEIGATAETVEVTDIGPAINTTSPDFASLINQHALDDLPVNNYRWSAYAAKSRRS